jgi:Holliday junction resolvase
VVVKTAIKQLLKERGIWYCMPVGSGYGTSGVPDLICCDRGRFRAIEVKAPGKRGNTTALQDRQIMAIHQAGGSAVVVDSVRQVQEMLDAKE